MSTDLIARAQAGDEAAFAALVAPHRRELEVHCYRILGSSLDAEDAVQETLLDAWRGIGGFEARASLRTWLYGIATHRCLDALRAARRRPVVRLVPNGLEPNRAADSPWFEPYPDVLLADLPDDNPGPAARYEAKEAISLAFVTALQLLPPRQRAVLVLRDVLGFRAREVAGLLDSTEESVSSALKRARATVQGHHLAPGASASVEPTDRAAEQRLVERLTTAYAVGDVAGVVALLTDDVVLATPLAVGLFQGREAAAQLLATVVFGGGRTYRLIPTRANGQLAFGLYVRDPVTGVEQASGLLVLTLAGGRISAMTRFDTSTMPLFHLPLTITPQ